MNIKLIKFKKLCISILIFSGIDKKNDITTN